MIRQTWRKLLCPDPEDVTIEAFGVDQVVLRWGATASGQNLAFIAVIKTHQKLTVS